MRAHERWSARIGLTGLGLLAALAIGCTDDSKDETTERIVGSGNVTEKVVDAMYVERVTVDIPFRATVYDGTAHVIRIEGEDNLLDLIDINEIGERNGEWEISAPDVKFVQTKDMRIEIPFIDMVYISLKSADVTFGDQPAGSDDGSVSQDAAAANDDDAGS